MDVEFRRSAKVKCSTVNVGSCFIYGKCLFITVHNDSGCAYNCFNVDENRLETVYKDTMVTPVYMKMVEV